MCVCVCVCVTWCCRGKPFQCTSEYIRAQPAVCCRAVPTNEWSGGSQQGHWTAPIYVRYPTHIVRHISIHVPHKAAVTTN